jgi:hypothetical protein
VLPLDADNLLRPGFLASAAAVLDAQPDVAVVYPDRELIGRQRGLVNVPEPDLDILCAGNYIDACALIRRDVLRAEGAWDATLPAGGLEDWELWIRLLSRGRQFHHLAQAGFDYRIRPGQMSGNLQDPATVAALVRAVVDRHEGVFAATVRTTIPRLLRATVDLRRRLDRTSG